jgi:DNA topoisomerase IB
VAEALFYWPDSNTGIRREKRRPGFSDIHVDGTRIDCPKKRPELNALAVPPAYTDVWMAAMDNADLPAAGCDARPRTQCRVRRAPAHAMQVSPRVGGAAGAGQVRRSGRFRAEPAAADRLHNTPAVAHKSNIQPDVLELARLKSAAHRQELPRICTARDGFRRDEEALIEFLC